MTAEDLTGAPVLNFQSNEGSDGNCVEATPRKAESPRNIGQFVWELAWAAEFAQSNVNNVLKIKRRMDRKQSPRSITRVKHFGNGLLPTRMNEALKIKGEAWVGKSVTKKKSDC
jgi:hypothetical protein